MKMLKFGVGMGLIVSNQCWTILTNFKESLFRFFKLVHENRPSSYFFLNRELMRTILDIRFFPKQKNPVLKLRGSLQFENSRFSWSVLTSWISKISKKNYIKIFD